MCYMQLFQKNKASMNFFFYSTYYRSIFYVFIYIFCYSLPSAQASNTIIATHYTGNTWAPSFWSNININDVKNDLITIQKNGFNTIILIVPWTGFQLSIEPIQFIEEYFYLLDRIINIAMNVGMKVILRIGYEHEIGTEINFVNIHHKISIFQNSQVLKAWSKYLEKLYNLVKKYKNFIFGFLSWEDFFFIYYTNSNLNTRTKLSKQIGFQDYLKKYSIPQISAIYEKIYQNYEDIPIPKIDSPALNIYHQFWDQYLLKLIKHSRIYFPKMSMEVRVDCDLFLYSGQRICHETTFDIANESEITLIYFSPAWGAANTGDFSTAEEAIKRMIYMIDWVKKYTDNQIFIDQFNFIDNTPGFSHNTQLLEKEIPEFINQAKLVLSKNTIGYALWTMTDVKANFIKNGSFERGFSGWQLKKAKLIQNQDKSEKEIILQNNGQIKQMVNFGGHVNSKFEKDGLEFKLDFSAKSQDPKGSFLFVVFKNQSQQHVYSKNIKILPDFLSTYQLSKIPLFKYNDIILEIENKQGIIIIDKIELYCIIQENGIYDVNGSPKEFSQDIKNLNKYFKK